MKQLIDELKAEISYEDGKSAVWRSELRIEAFRDALAIAERYARAEADAVQAAVAAERERWLRLLIFQEPVTKRWNYCAIGEWYDSRAEAESAIMQRVQEGEAMSPSPQTPWEPQAGDCVRYVSIEDHVKALEAERRACVKIADDEAVLQGNECCQGASKEIAEAIRARGSVKP